MYLLDTDEFITFDSDVSDETGNVMAPRRGTIEGTFLWPPVYRSPCFPVFFYAGNRRYNRDLSRYPKDESHTIDPHIVTLAKALHYLGDELRETDSLRRACDVQFLSISPQPISLYNLVMYPKILIACVARRFLRRLKRFTRGRGSDRNALEKMEQLVMPERKLAEYSLPGKSHLQISSDPGQSARGSSCLSYSLSASGDESDAQVEMEASLKAVNYSVPNTQPTCCPLQMSSDPGWSRRGSSCLLRSLSVPSLSQVTSAKNKTFTRAKSLPDLLLENSFEEFTPDITVDENDEAYWLRCSCPGLYQCRVTGLVFHMEGEGDVVYRIVPWNRRLLAQHHKQPAGPLFDIKCLQQSVCQLHLPHCEICSTGGCDLLSVAHVNDEGIEFIIPHEITESHVVVNITGFSAFGNVKDADSPPDPVRALVLLFYRPPADPDPTSLLNVLLLPRNVVLQDVLRTRKKLVGDESYIEMSPHCKLHPKQEYTLSTCPEDDSVLIQPKDAEFDCDNYDNYFPSFQLRFHDGLRLSHNNPPTQRLQTALSRSSHPFLIGVKGSFLLQYLTIERS
uniref:uncharacterized protein LOC124049759 isoform X3 n=1 Tax=Scatophagus argus TaxID=75038 RepID=UPI001ED7DC1A|nr:uncharacterized protein LOC124049759 isoform X3 [Scatophagus argus]